MTDPTDRNSSLAEAIATFQKAAETLQLHGLRAGEVAALTASTKKPRRRQANGNALFPRLSGATTVDLDASRLREARAYSDTRQNAVLDETGIPKDVISKIEKGHRTAIDRDAAIKLADALGVPLSFLCGEGSMILGADKPLYDRIRIARKRLNCSQRALAQKLNIPMHRVFMWERGISLEEVDFEALANILKVPVEYLSKPPAETN